MELEFCTMMTGDKKPLLDGGGFLYDIRNYEVRKIFKLYILLYNI
jgi:hypothetical protein